MRKVFLEDLPRLKSGNNKGKINWKEAIGYKVKFIYDDIKSEIEIIKYSPQERYLYIKYIDKKGFRISTTNFLSCKFAKLLGRKTDEFKVNIGQIFKDEKRDITIIDRKYEIKKIKDGYDWNKKLYKYNCNKCGYDEGWMVEGNLLKGNGCSVCKGLTVVEGINDISTTDPWMIKYFQGGYDEAKLYTKASNKKIKPICPECGRVKDKKMAINDLYSRKSIGCSCGDGQSYPNKFMFSLLEQLKIDFISEYSPNWIGLKRYDFYFELNNNKYIVEMDGGWHKLDNLMSGITSEEVIATDDYKDEQAKLHNINVIRINSDKSELKYIKDNILNSKLNILSDLLKIDWLKCEEFALSNRVKEACELKRDNSEMTTGDIGEIMKIEISNIINYLKKGTKLGWCDYDPKEEKRKGSKKAGKILQKRLSKPVEIFKDGISLGIFKSCKELEKQSEELFGIRLRQGNISSTCRGKTKQHNGFTFKYI